MSEPASAVSPAEPLSGQAALDSWTPDERASWYQTGEPPAPKPVAEPVATEPDDEPEPEVAAEPEKPAAPIAAKPEPAKPISKRQQQINDLIRERTTEKQRAEQLEKELAALKARQPEPAKPEAAEAPPVEASKRPDPSTFDDYDKYIEALTDWKLEQRESAQKAAAEKAKAEKDETERRTAREQRFATWIERRDTFAASTPEWKEHADPFLANVTEGGILADVLMESPIGPEMALYLGKHLDQVDRIARLQPAQQLYELGKIEASLSLARTPASAVPAARHVSQAPAPPQTLGTRPADPVDEITGAVAAGNFSAYAAAANRREIAASRR